MRDVQKKTPQFCFAGTQRARSHRVNEPVNHRVQLTVCVCYTFTAASRCICAVRLALRCIASRKKITRWGQLACLMSAAMRWWNAYGGIGEMVGWTRARWVEMIVHSFLRSVVLDFKLWLRHSSQNGNREHNFTIATLF